MNIGDDDGAVVASKWTTSHQTADNDSRIIIEEMFDNGAVCLELITTSRVAARAYSQTYHTGNG